jgi:hypothetical protein
LFLVAYLAQAVVALSLGKVATFYGLTTAVDIGVATIAVLALVTILLDLVRQRAAFARSRKPQER